MPEKFLNIRCFQTSLKERSFFKRILFTGFVCLISFINPLHGYSQSDTLKTTTADSTLEKLHSAKKATIMSACLPGLGQIYNKKYWKVPIIYAGFGALTYFIVFNANYYNTFRGAYIGAMNKDSTKYRDLIIKYTPTDLLSARDYYRRNLEVTCLITVLWYIINILDATVDAHLFTYNINKELSMKIDPVMMSPVYSRNFTTGVKLSFKF